MRPLGSLVSASREQFIAVRGEGVSYRLELTQRAAIAIVLTAFGGIAILDYFEVRLGLFASQWALSGVGVAVTLVVLLSAWFRHRQGPILTAFLLMGAAVVTCIYADDVLLVTTLAVGVTSAGYLATLFVGFLAPCALATVDRRRGNKRDITLRLDFEHAGACRDPVGS